MISFALLWEELERQQSESSPLMDSGDENESMQVIRAGLNLGHDNDPTFWNNLINLCSNAKGVAHLLGVREEDVAGWPTKIRKTLEDVQKADQQRPDKEQKEKQKMIPTGDNGAITMSNIER